MAASCYDSYPGSQIPVSQTSTDGLKRRNPLRKLHLFRFKRDLCTDTKARAVCFDGNHGVLTRKVDAAQSGLASTIKPKTLRKRHVNKQCKDLSPGFRKVSY